MSKAVLISIRPEWVERICCCGKYWEIRKTRPTIQPPFKCYIYKTKKRVQTGIVAEFVCDEILHLTHVGTCEKDIRLAVEDGDGLLVSEMVPEICWDSMLSEDQIEDYLRGGDGYAWHISELKLYKNYRSLNDFYFPQDKYCEKGLCGGCPKEETPGPDGDCMWDCEWKRPIKRPPQSWCYVEEV